MDPPIKLFGQTIAFTTWTPCGDDVTPDGTGQTSTSPGAREELLSSEDIVKESGVVSRAKSDTIISDSPASCLPERSASGNDSADEEKPSPSSLEVNGLVQSSEAPRCRVVDNNEDLDVEGLGFGRGEGTSGQEVNVDDVGGRGSKMRKKPGKPVACPRCHSLETKFCYYNNYKSKQPRHFCKHCQRYWTAGGTLRNLPVGAGRRKNKHGSVTSPRPTTEMGFVRGDEGDIAAPLPVGVGVTPPIPMPLPVVSGGRQICPTEPKILVPETAGGSSDAGGMLPYAMQVPSLDVTYIPPSEVVKPNDAGTLGVNLPHLAFPGFNEVTMGANTLDSTYAPFNGPGSSTLLHDCRGESGGFSPGYVTPPWSNGRAAGVRGSHGATQPSGFFDGRWSYGYSGGWNGGAPVFPGGVASAGNVMPPPTPAGVAAWSGMTVGGCMWTGVPWPMPDLAWNPATGWVSPWPIGPNWAMGPAVAMSPAVSTGLPTTSVPSSLSGKDASSVEGGQVEGTVWAPTSLRMANPEEAMRNSVWRIQGAGGSRPDETTSTSFEAFQSKTSKIADDEQQQIVQAKLHANPAAMSRSMYFHETN